VGILETLEGLGLGQSVVDLMSIDIEGAEADVLRCFPFDKIHVRFVLIETNKHDMRKVDGFFSAHGFANMATFPGFDTRQGAWGLDNLYMRNPLVPPPGVHTSTNCSKQDLKIDPWCGPFRHHKLLSEPWGRCKERFRRR